MKNIALASNLLLVAACASGGLPGGEAIPGAATIRAADLEADLGYLASDAMGGRLSQTIENRIAAEFIASRFVRIGLEPGNGDSYFHEYDLMAFAVGDGNRLTAVTGGGTLMATIDTDAAPMMFSGSGSVEGSLVFAGFGIVAEPLGHNDYGDADLAGRIVLVLDHEPGENDPASVFDGVVTSEASRDWRKALAAQQRGAAGILFVQDVHNHPGRLAKAQARFSRASGVPLYAVAEQIDQITIPAGRVSPAFAEQLVSGSGRSLEQLAVDAERPGAGVSEIAGTLVQMSIAVARSRVPDRNVVGLLRGADPALADELVIVCAHYDHDGRDGERVFNGADDDGSGTVGVMEIAEAYAAAAAAGHRPRRSVLFAAWNTEEHGLLGAWGWIASPAFDARNTVAVLNMDMIGRNEEVPAEGGGRFRGLEVQDADDNANSVQLMGYTYSSRLREAVVEANAAIGLDLELEYDNNVGQLLRRSDHWPFLQVGIPALFFHTGLHPDYHRETDTVDRINFAKMERIVRLVHATSWEIANADERPSQDERRGTL